ncbi:unnamed protein product [Acanthosepion pharaonis]|uniref:LolA-like domain-containing protein n=1 Tax=Acanthosepion pharaonis TaxID=158019 RepID=A0A812CQR9_ACAPH|nr:unnamed protein product [Sepia pharaonis]
MVNESVVIRGIETSHWRYQLTKGIANLTIDTYFTNGWNSEAGTKQNIPVRYDVFGKLKNNPFHVIYDFYFFQYRDRFWFEDEVVEFEMPTTVLCEGADVSAKLPEIADTYSYTVEIIDSNLYSIEISKVWYDKNNKLLRQDFHPSSYPLSGYPNDWKLYPDFGGPDEQLSSIPIMMEVFIKDQQTSGFDSNMIPYYTYNFIDFTNDVNAGVFSIPQCYSRNTEIYFKIGFPGVLYPATMNSMRKKMHSLIAAVSGIFPHRVQKLSIHDDSNFFYKEKIKYTARTIELVFGVIDIEGNPKFPAQMSYRVEFSEPALEKVNFHAVWYDSERKLLRLDERFSKPKAPFYSLNPLTTINDFSEGAPFATLTSLFSGTSAFVKQIVSFHATKSNISPFTVTSEET